MRFAEAMKLDHCWLGLLSWWNHRVHDKEVPHNIIFAEKTRIKAFNGVEKVMGVARVFEPTRGDTEVVSTIMKEHMTVPYRYQVEYYLRKYNIPKWLRILKLWLWDVNEDRQRAPDPTEDAETKMHRVQQLVTIAHNHDWVSEFPNLARRNRRIADMDMIMAVHNDTVRKRCYQQSPPPPPKRRPMNGGYATTNIKKIELSSDNDGSDNETTKNKTGEEKAGGPITPPPPMPPMYEPVTPPHPPPPPQDDSDDDGSSRPPRVSRPRPTDL